MTSLWKLCTFFENSDVLQCMQCRGFWACERNDIGQWLCLKCRCGLAFYTSVAIHCVTAGHSGHPFCGHKENAQMFLQSKLNVKTKWGTCQGVSV